MGAYDTFAAHFYNKASDGTINSFGMTALRSVIILFLLFFIGYQMNAQTIPIVKKHVSGKGSSSKTANTFINNYVQFLNERNFEIELIDWINLQPVVTDQFKSELGLIIKKFKKDDTETGLGFDPILNAQDYPEKGFYIDDVDLASVNIILKGIEWSSFKISMRLVQKKGVWLVDGSGIINITEEKRMKN